MGNQVNNTLAFKGKENYEATGIKKYQGFGEFQFYKDPSTG